MSQNFELLRQLEADFRFTDVVPEEIPLVATPSERSNREFSQQLLALAQTVFLSDGANAPHTVVLSGIDRDNASSEICVDLGRILAAYSARPVCLVDAHTGSPRLEKMLRGDQPISFPDSNRDHCQEITPNLWLAQLNIKGALKEGAFGVADDLKEQLGSLQQTFGLVLIDTPAVNTRAEAAVLGQLVDGVILIIEANVTRKAAALKARQGLESMNVRILGSILNNRTLPIPEALYRRL
jgi:Mrp family chromosome partitioning ATPase